MITAERIQELIKLVEDWHYQSSDGDILLELVEIVKQQQAEVNGLRKANNVLINKLKESTHE